MSSDWEFKRLGEHCEKIGSGATPKGGKDAYLDYGPVHLIRSQNIYNDGFKASGLAYISEAQAKKLDNVKVQVGDVLLNITGDSVARVCQAPEQYLPARVNQHVAIIRSHPISFDAKYLRYFLASSVQQSYMLGLAAAGATRNALTKVMIEDFQVPCPPLGVQYEIAQVLGSLDDRITLLREINTTLEAIAQALFKSWFVDFDPVHAKQQGRAPEGMDAQTAALFPDSFEESELGMVPKGWVVYAVENFAERVGMGPFGSNIKVETFVDTGIPVISGQHLKQLLVEDNKFNYITKEHAAKLERSCVHEGDVIFTHAGSIGQVSLLHKDAAFKSYVLSQRQFFLRCRKELMSPEWIVLYFKSPIGQHQLLANTSQVGVPSIARPVSYLRSIRLVVPPPELNQRFASIASSINSRVMANRKQISALIDIRDTLLPRLISGQLRLPEAQALVEEAAA